MNRHDRINSLFNELHRELSTLANELPTAELGEIDPHRIASSIDALHHDYMNIHLEPSLKKELT